LTVSSQLHSSATLLSGRHFSLQPAAAMNNCAQKLNRCSHLWIGQVYVQQGRYDEAIAEINRAIALSGGNVRDIATLGHAYAVSGRKDEALKVIGELQAEARQKYVSPYFIALIYTGLGEKEQSFAWLEKAFEQRHPYLILIKVEPVFDSLRSDPRFVELMRKVGLPQ
jgi:tetratricopeptide (TPR) repeat protein